MIMYGFMPVTGSRRRNCYNGIELFPFLSCNLVQNVLILKYIGYVEMRETSDLVKTCTETDACGSSSTAFDVWSGCGRN